MIGNRLNKWDKEGGKKGKMDSFWDRVMSGRNVIGEEDRKVEGSEENVSFVKDSWDEEKDSWDISIEKK